MKYLILIALMCVQFTYGFGQHYIKGVVLDSLTNKPLEYATVVNLSLGKGVFTDEKGEFEILINSKSDRFEFSNMGYKAKLITELKANEKVMLVEAPILISEVSVKKRELKKHSVEVGFHNEETKSRNWGPGGEVPTVFVVRINNNGISDGQVDRAYFKLGKYTIGQNGFSKARVRVYSADKQTGYPAEDLLRANVIVKINPFSQSFSIDLEKYHLLFPKEGVFIGLEFFCHTEKTPLGKGRYAIKSNCPDVACTLIKDYKELGESYYLFYHRDKGTWQWIGITNGELSKNFRGQLFQFGAKVSYYD